ncbi:MAG: carboxypeptidase-like regulatory domain-containing protein [Myxococcota bacterium]|nr:carboxypeptidase-like regulatory domain-containing protein [Myxococcota bacterium]
MLTAHFPLKSIPSLRIRALRVFLVSLTLSLSWSCTAIDADNPYDPRSGADDRALGLITGRLSPPGEDVNALSRVRVELRRLAERDQLFATMSPEEGGRFTFESLAEDRYELSISLEGFTPYQQSIALGLAEVVDLGEITLQPRVDPRTGQNSIGVEGIARREGAAESEHGGILVEALDSPFAAVTSGDGRFYLPLPPQSQKLRF